MRAFTLAIFVIASLTGCASPVLVPASTPGKVGASLPVASPSAPNEEDLGFALQNNSTSTVTESVNSSCMSSIPSQYFTNYPVAPGQSMSYTMGTVQSGGCLTFPASIPQVSMNVAQPGAPGVIMVVNAAYLSVSGAFNYSANPLTSPCLAIHNYLDYVDDPSLGEVYRGRITIGITIPPGGLGKCFVPQPVLPPLQAAGSGDVSFSVLNSSTQTLGFTISTNCMSSTPTAWWPPFGFALTPGAQLSDVIGTTASGSCGAESSTTLLTVSGDDPATGLSNSVHAFLTYSTAIGGSVFGYGLDPDFDFGSVQQSPCINIINDFNGSAIYAQLTIPPSGIGSC